MMHFMGYFCAVCVLLTIMSTEVSGFCDYFECKPECETTYRNGCPHNCNCKPARDDCPDIYCSFGDGTCLKRINPDIGCQECVCRDQVVTPHLTLPSRNLNKAKYDPEAWNKGASTNNRGVPSQPRPKPSPSTHTFRGNPSPSPSSSFSSSSSSSSNFNRPKPVAPRTRTPSSGGSSNTWTANKALTSDVCDQARKNAAASALAGPLAVINANRGASSAAFPPIFQVTSADSTCTEYRAALKRVDGKTIRLCRGQDPMLDEVFANFEVACGSGTFYLFKKDHHCFAGLRGNPTVSACEASASKSCSGYSTLARCIAPTVKNLSGACRDAWELHWQILNRYARQWDDNCRIDRA